MKTSDELVNHQNYRKPNFGRLYGVLFLILLGLIVFNSRFFGVKAVLVKGNQTLSTADILRNTNLSLYKNIFQINCKKLQKIILRNPRIAAAKVYYVLPDKIAIEVQERHPLCLLLFADNYVIIGEDGVAMGIKAENEPIKLPIVTGIIISKISIGESVKSSQFDAAMEILRLADENLRVMLSEIDLQNYVLYIDLPNSNHTLKVELGNGEQLAEKISKELRSILSHTAADELIKIDLRVPSFPTVIRNSAHR
jgi:cell division septal protein FtsQ